MSPTHDAAARRPRGGRDRVDPDQAGQAVLARAGFTDGRRAATLLAEVTGRVQDAPGGEGFSAAELAQDLAATADPDGALLGLVRLLDPRSTGAALERCDEHVLPVIQAGGQGRQRLLTLLGGSVALGEHLLRHPAHVTDVAQPLAPEARDVVEAVRGLRGDTAEGPDALRVAYRRQLLRIARADLTCEDPVALMPTVSGALADLASAALQGAVLLARAETAGEAGVDFTVIGMGKTGGRELNYISDVDVIFLAAPREGTSEEEVTRVGTSLASAVMRIAGQSTDEGTLWQVDAALRPEGHQGPLIRSLRSHKEYYERWAKTWEFQALLKARVVAGDPGPGKAWLDMVTPLVWEAAERENFVDDVQAMRRRVEQHVKKQESDRQLKLGPGGLRDIEFSVQLLQLVHGRTDESLRSGSTLEALRALTDGGYVGRDDLKVLDPAYRLLRTLEHRIQLHRMRRTHLMPTSETDLRRLGRSLGERGGAEQAVLERWRSVQRDVRRLHERLFYRPLLSAVARLSTDEATLSPEAARARLSALGFRDPAGAMRHLVSLTEGVSRRATIQRHLLPVMLSWFADGADPDSGLLAFRQISDKLGTTHWYLGMLRDEGTAAQRLARVLSSSRYAVDLLIRSPETVALLGDEGAFVAPDKDTLRTRMATAARRRSDTRDAFAAVRSVRARELIRIVLGDVTAGWDGPTVRTSLSDLTEAYLDVALEVAQRGVLERRGEELATRMLVVGMGRLGGRELGYASDADVLFVHDPLPGQDPEVAGAQAAEIVSELRQGLAGAGPDPVLELDAGLRPEGKNGPMVRTLEGYRSYYERWSAGWESQALLRARPVAGDTELGERFVQLVEPLRWPEGGIDRAAVREIRKLKARMEAERLPRGADPRTHLKLGLGGLTDVEWVVQLIQLQHAHEHPGLRTTGTVEALEAAAEAQLVSRQDAEQLLTAWMMASQLRDAGIVWRGRPVESVPSDARDAEGMARVMLHEAGRGGQLAQAWRRAARRSRVVVERLLYGDRPPRTEATADPVRPRRFGATRPVDGRGGRGGFGRPRTSAGPPPGDGTTFGTDTFGRPRAAAPRTRRPGSQNPLAPDDPPGGRLGDAPERDRRGRPGERSDDP